MSPSVAYVTRYSAELKIDKGAKISAVLRRRPRQHTGRLGKYRRSRRPGRHNSHWRQAILHRRLHDFRTRTVRIENMYQPMAVVSNVCAHLKIGVSAALLHQVTHSSDIGNFKTDMEDRPILLPLILVTCRWIIGIQWRIFCLGVPVRIRRLNVVAAASRKAAVCE